MLPDVLMRRHTANDSFANRRHPPRDAAPACVPHKYFGSEHIKIFSNIPTLILRATGRKRKEARQWPAAAVVPVWLYTSVQMLKKTAFCDIWKSIGPWSRYDWLSARRMLLDRWIVVNLKAIIEKRGASVVSSPASVTFPHQRDIRDISPHFTVCEPGTTECGGSAAPLHRAALRALYFQQ